MPITIDSSDTAATVQAKLNKAALQEYEYTFLRLSNIYQIDNLNEMAAEGWRLIAMCDLDEADSTYQGAILERKL